MLFLIVKRRVSQVRPSASGRRLGAGDHLSLCQSCGCADGVGVGSARVARVILILALLVILILRPWRSSSSRRIAPTRSNRLLPPGISDSMHVCQYIPVFGAC
jgi:hypothetical protein